MRSTSAQLPWASWISVQPSWTSRCTPRRIAWSRSASEGGGTSRPTSRGPGIAGYAGEPERRAVRHRGVAVRAGQDDRVVGGHPVEVLPGREDRRLPERLDPAAPAHPLPRLRLVDPRLHPGEELLEGVGPLEVEGHLPLPQGGKVHVRVGEAGIASTVNSQRSTGTACALE